MSHDDESAVVVHVHKHEPAPAIVSRVNSHIFGIEPEAWRATVRKLGLPHRRVGHDLLVLADDLVAAIKAGAKVAPPKPRPKKVADEPETLDACLARAGFRKAGS
jgi:hypothetical protein